MGGSCGSGSFLLDCVLLGGLLGKSLVLGISKQKKLVHVPFGSVLNERTHSLGYKMGQAVKKTRPENEQKEDKENGSQEGRQPRGQPVPQPQSLDPRAGARAEFRSSFSEFPCCVPD